MPARDSEAIRRELVARIPGWYIPWVHLVGPSLVGFALIATAVRWIERPSVWELLFVLPVLVLANANEWVLHKGVLHHRVPGLGFAFERHTPQHHGAFTCRTTCPRTAPWGASRSSACCAAITRATTHPS